MPKYTGRHTMIIHDVFPRFVRDADGCQDQMNDVFMAQVKCDGFARVESGETRFALLREDVGMSRDFKM
jgi:hypothetical protein